MKFLLLSAVLLGATPFPLLAGDPPDLDRYLETIREQGMSEGARQALDAVSVVRLQQGILHFQRDETSGRYWYSYSSTTCPDPLAGPEQITAWKAELARARDADVALLKDLADTDGSGFVTTEEGVEFRMLAEFAILALQLREEGRDGVVPLAAAAGIEIAEVNARLQACGELVARADAAGLDPPLPDPAPKWIPTEIALLLPQDSPGLPDPIRLWLTGQGFAIPQSSCAAVPNNAFEAPLGGSSTRDWAILCSRADTSRIVIFWDGRPDSTLELNPSPDAAYVQDVGQGQGAYSRLITPAPPAEMLQRYHDYETEPPVVVDHTAVEDAFCEKGSTINYWHQGRMVQLMGAD